MQIDPATSEHRDSGKQDFHSHVTVQAIGFEYKCIAFLFKVVLQVPKSLAVHLLAQYQIEEMSGALSLILDDNSGDFTYSGGQWTLSTIAQWYKETSWWPAFAYGTDLGSFTLNFEGA